jgi:hypothetical protein
MPAALNNFRTTLVDLTTTTGNVYTPPVGYATVVLMAQVSNTGNSTVQITAGVNRTGNTTLLINQASVPVNDAITVLTGRLILNFGDTLDGDYISQQFVKGANREYGKSYYVDTTNFFSQGEFNVKTTFASDPLLRIPGTGLSGSVGGINPPIAYYSAGSYDFTNINNSTAACGSGAEMFEIFTEDGNITTGQIAYYDQYGDLPVRGYYYFSNS